MKKLTLSLFCILTIFFSLVSANESQPSFTLQTLSWWQQVCTQNGQPVDCSVMIWEQWINADMREVPDYNAEFTGTSKCVVNWEEVPCSDAMELAKDFFGATMWLFLVWGVLALIGTVFWIWMLVDAIRFHEKDKWLWIVLQIVLGAIGSIIYFFAARKPRKAHKS